jgi:hypothetical protein
VITDVPFHDLYKLCVERCNTVICSANPDIKEEYFTKRNLPLPHKIHACKGKYKKLVRLVNLNSKYDHVFYVDNEKEYLEFAWIFGIQTFLYNKKQITYFTLKSE